MSKVLKRIEEMKTKRKLRSKTRPFRASTLLDKSSSQSGADLRVPLMGGTKFPTNDSGISEAQEKLKKHQSVGDPKMERMSVKSITPSFQTADVMPKTGGAMIKEDPLIQYLRKTAGAPSIPSTVKTEKAGVLPDNKEDMVTAKGVSELSTEPADDPKDNTSDWRNYLAETLGQKEGITTKHREKDHPYKAGVVDKALAAES